MRMQLPAQTGVEVRNLSGGFRTERILQFRPKVGPDKTDSGFHQVRNISPAYVSTYTSD